MQHYILQCNTIFFKVTYSTLHSRLNKVSLWFIRYIFLYIIYFSMTSFVFVRGFVCQATGTHPVRHAILFYLYIFFSKMLKNILLYLYALEFVGWVRGNDVFCLAGYLHASGPPRYVGVQDGAGSLHVRPSSYIPKEHVPREHVPREHVLREHVLREHVLRENQNETAKQITQEDTFIT